MHATRMPPIAIVSTAPLGSPYGVFVGLRVSDRQAEQLEAAADDQAELVHARSSLDGVNAAERAPVASIVHAAAEDVDVVDGDAADGHASAAPACARGVLTTSTARHLLARHRDARAQHASARSVLPRSRMSSTTSTVRPASALLGRTRHSRSRAARVAAIPRDVHVVELVRELEALAELERGERAAVHHGEHDGIRCSRAAARASPPCGRGLAPRRAPRYKRRARAAHALRRGRRRRRLSLRA